MERLGECVLQLGGPGFESLTPLGLTIDKAIPKVLWFAYEPFSQELMC